MIPISIMGVSKYAKKIFAKYWGIYTSMGDTFLDSVQGLKELKIFKADTAKHKQINASAGRVQKNYNESTRDAAYEYHDHGLDRVCGRGGRNGSRTGRRYEQRLEPCSGFILGFGRGRVFFLPLRSLAVRST